MLTETSLPNPLARGKVRDTYDLGERLLMVASDRISAFDIVLPDGIPDKGAVLTQMSAFWFQRTANVIPNHMIRIADGSPADGLPYALPREYLGQTMIVHKAQRVDAECIVRGYITGTAWSEYQKSQSVCGIALPSGLRESDRFPEPLFTPATKADIGLHDENITFQQLANLVGSDTAARLRDASLAIYARGAKYALERGIIIADTKFEFGWLNGELIVIDEMLTPDSSRFWDAATYESGKHQEALDKQFTRDWLLASGWDRKPPAPRLPSDVIDGTAERYRQAYRRITGLDLQRFGG